MPKNVVRNQRGSVLILFMGMLVLMLGLGGLATDFGYFVAVQGELRRSMDAAALAGAANLGFDATAFPAAVAAAQHYASINPYTGGTVSLSASDVITGIWDPSTRTFTPSSNGLLVNAVRCQYSTTVPTTLLNIVGVASLPINVDAIGVSNPPTGIPPDANLFPLGMSACPFMTGGQYSSAGCGRPVFMSTATLGNMAWINTGTRGSVLQTPSDRATRDAIDAVNAGTGGGTTLTQGSYVGTQNGADSNIVGYMSNCDAFGRNCRGYFETHYNAPTTYMTYDTNHNVTYNGHGWEVYIAIISTDCPSTNITQQHQVLTFARFVMTQVIYQGYCGVANHWPGNNWDAMCPAPNGTAAARDANLAAVFGYFDCESFDSDQVGNPAPRAALATRMRLVQ